MHLPSVHLNISNIDIQQDLAIQEPTNNVPHIHNNQVQAQVRSERLHKVMWELKREKVTLVGVNQAMLYRKLAFIMHHSKGSVQ